MRLNKFIALATGISRRAADKAITDGRVGINGKPAKIGEDVTTIDIVTLDDKPLQPTKGLSTYLFHKPAGYVVSRDGQGNKTIYDLIPPDLHGLKPIGRLDKDSSGLPLLTNDGQLANELTHPRHQKIKIYEIELLKPLQVHHQKQIMKPGVQLEDGLSRLQLEPLDHTNKHWRVSMSEGRNRQIRRTFATLGYTVHKLHRIQFGPHRLDRIAEGALIAIYNPGNKNTSA